MSPHNPLESEKCMKLRKAIFISYSPRGDAASPGGHIPGWGIVTVRDPRKARRAIEEHDARVGLALCESGPDRRNAHLFEQLTDELETQGMPVQWIALVPDRSALDDNLSRLIGRRFFDFHTLPVNPDRLVLTLGHAYGMAPLRRARRRAGRPAGGSRPLRVACHEHKIIGASPAMMTLCQDLRRIAEVDAPVLISGETGTGKELAARAIHRLSARSQGSFVAINCAALSPSLIQSELFGYERGAFTGANQRSPGRIELAAGGTLFLDEIGDLPQELQVNLLRFLQERTIERVGGRREITIDARVIAATHIDLQQAVEQGRFREDLYHRIHVLPIKVPALRERGHDAILLARYYLEKYSTEVKANVLGFSDEALEVLRLYRWPGNVRELANCVHRAAIMCTERWITPAHLGLESCGRPGGEPPSLEHACTQGRIAAIQQALQYTSHNVSRAAQLLGVSRRTLYRMLKHYGLGRGRTGSALTDESPA
jgi:DNA-binding NtrC family response regulator